MCACAHVCVRMMIDVILITNETSDRGIKANELAHLSSLVQLTTTNGH